MTDLKNRLTSLQSRVGALINSTELLAGHDIISEDKGDLENRIRTSLAKLGLAICVMTPALTVKSRSNSRVILKVKIVIDISETAILNKAASGERLPALDAALAVRKACDWKTTGLGSPRPDTELDRFEMDKDAPLTLVPDPTLICYHVNLATYISF